MSSDHRLLLLFFVVLIGDAVLWFYRPVLSPFRAPSASFQKPTSLDTIDTQSRIQHPPFFSSPLTHKLQLRKQPPIKLLAPTPPPAHTNRPTPKPQYQARTTTAAPASIHHALPCPKLFSPPASPFSSEALSLSAVLQQNSNRNPGRRDHATRAMCVVLSHLAQGSSHEDGRDV